MEPQRPTPRGAWAALGLAGLVLAASVAFASFRDKRPAPDLAAANAQEPVTIDMLQQRARAAPDDADAWAALGMARFDEGAHADAAVALGRATALAPQRPELWSLLGEARVMASPRDPMPQQALDAFRKAVAIDPRDPRSRYFLAVARDLSGDHKGAIADWLALLADTPPGAPWEGDLRRTIQQVGKINGIEVETRITAIQPPSASVPVLGGPAIPGPSAEQMREAARLAPREQDAMARAMVASLEDKLKANPVNVDGWLMLMRSRMTLREPTKAAAALQAAVAANPAARPRLEAEARALGVP